MSNKNILIRSWIVKAKHDRGMAANHNFDILESLLGTMEHDK